MLRMRSRYKVTFVKSGSYPSYWRLTASRLPRVVGSARDCNVRRYSWVVEWSSCHHLLSKHQPPLETCFHSVTSWGSVFPLNVFAISHTGYLCQPTLSILLTRACLMAILPGELNNDCIRMEIAHPLFSATYCVHGTRMCSGDCWGAGLYVSRSFKRQPDC